MERDTAQDTPRADDAAPWKECDHCGLLDHPGLSCADAAELIRARALRELLRQHGPILLAALEDAVDDRVERSDGDCVDCERSGDGRCAIHQADLERAGEYRRTYTVVSAAVEA